MERPFSPYHQLHMHTPLSASRSRTISLMAAQSLWNVILPGKLAIISQRLQLSQLCGVGKRGKEQWRTGTEPGRCIQFVRREARGSALTEAGRKEKQRRRVSVHKVCQWYVNTTFTSQQTSWSNRKTRKVTQQSHMGGYSSLLSLLNWVSSIFKVANTKQAVFCVSLLFDDSQ